MLGVGSEKIGIAELEVVVAVSQLEGGEVAAAEICSIKCVRHFHPIVNCCCFVKHTRVLLILMPLFASCCHSKESQTA